MPRITRPSRKYLTALHRLYASSRADRSRDAWHALSREEQAAAVNNMAAAGMSDHAIAAATGWAVEMVRDLLGRNPDGRR